MTEQRDENLNNAVSRLAQAWLRRSPAERAAFSTPIDQEPTLPEHVDSAMRTVRERAALCGAVKPLDLAQGLDRGDASHALDLLAPEFDRVQTAGRWLWTLRTAARSEILTSLYRDGGLSERLNEVADITTDRAGRLLRRLAEIRSPAPGEETDQVGSDLADDPATVVQALTWARSLGGFERDLAEAQRRAAVRLISQSYGLLTRHGVFGRERELDQLNDFIEASAGENPAKAATVPVLTLTGIGGAGKSTVLGACLKPFLKRIEKGDDPGCPAVVVLDFDRVLLRPTTELELSFEVTRQLGYAEPAAAAEFSALRGQLRAEQRDTGSERYASNVRKDSATREATAFEIEAGHVVTRYGLQDRRVLLVLDTFEEWQRERLDSELSPTTWNAPEQRIIDWINRLRTAVNLRNLRVIVSGRATLDGERDVLRSPRQPLVEVGDLAPQPAYDLLIALRIAAPEAEKLAAFVGGNPLQLQVAARFYQGLGEASRRELLVGEPLASDKLTAEIRRTVLYERFLEHIPDKQLQRLAHPGLLLRRITPEIVRSVLAEPCGLGKIDAREARRLTRMLANEVWLVDQTPYGLYHRREIRGPMLKLMGGEPKYADVSRRIHQAAVRWYENNGNGLDRLPSGLAEVEGFYHSLMLEAGDKVLAPVENPDRERWLQLAQGLRLAVDELPAMVAAQVRFERGEQVSDRDAVLLPGPVWQVWVARRGRELVDAGEPTAALEVIGSRPLTRLPECLGQACSDAGQWDRFWEAARSSGDLNGQVLLGSDRYGLLNALLSGNSSDLISYQSALASYYSVRDSRPRDPADDERLFCRLLTQQATSPGQPLAPLQLSEAPADGITADRFPVDQLRRMMTWIGTPAAGPDFVIENVASFLQPDPDWMRDFAIFIGAGADRTELNSFIGDVRSAAFGPDGLTTHALLGQWSSYYGQALGPGRIRVWRSHLRETADLIHVLRNDNPELRPAIHLALAGLAAKWGIQPLAAIAAKLTPLPAADLRPAVAADGDRRTLIQLIEYVDRSGRMREFLAEARRSWPGDAVLRRVTDAFGLWDEANNRLLDALAGHLRDDDGLSNA